MVIVKNGIAASCRDFQTNSSWRPQDIGMWVFDDQGFCYSNGEDDVFLWRRLGVEDGTENTPKDILGRLTSVGAQGGFTNFEWNNAYCHAYVKSVTVGKKKYLVGAYFYPASAIYLVDELVSSALIYLNATNINELAERINNPLGAFVRGDIHLSLYAMNGLCVANGEQVAFVGTNMYDATTGDNKFLVRDIIRLSQAYGHGWYSYRGFDGLAPARAFYKKVTDPATKKEYVLMASYYTDINDDKVISIVKQAVNYLKSNGKDIAFRDFNSQGERFSYGSVHIFVYDLAGKMMADTANPAFVGLSLINSRDTQGRPITKQIIDVAEANGAGWVTNNLRNAYQVAYVEKVKVPDGDFIIGAAYFPISKESKVRFMVSDAEWFLQNNVLELALQRFTRRDPDFMRGDLYMSLYTPEGICLADGLNLAGIWDKFDDQKDNQGKSIFAQVVAYAKSGGGWLSMPKRGGTYRMFIKGIPKIGPDGQEQVMVLTSGYFE